MPNKPQKDRFLAYLLGDGSLTDKQRCEIAEVAPNTLRAAKKRLEEETIKNGFSLTEYQQQLRTRISYEYRAERYEWLLKQTKHPMVVLKTLERLDALAGIVTARERKHQGEEAKVQPMFILPPGAKVQMSIPDEVEKALDVTPKPGPSGHQMDTTDKAEPTNTEESDT